jgi:hypothetical protein
MNNTLREALRRALEASNGSEYFSTGKDGNQSRHLKGGFWEAVQSAGLIRTGLGGKKERFRTPESPEPQDRWNGDLVEYNGRGLLGGRRSEAVPRGESLRGASWRELLREDPDTGIGQTEMSFVGRAMAILANRPIRSFVVPLA